MADMMDGLHWGLIRIDLIKEKPSVAVRREVGGWKVRHCATPARPERCALRAESGSGTLAFRPRVR